MIYFKNKNLTFYFVKMSGIFIRDFIHKTTERNQN